MSCWLASILRLSASFGGDDVQRQIEFEDFLAYKGDEIDNAAYELAVALLRTCPEQEAEDVLAWDISMLSPIIEAAQAVLQKTGKKTCWPYYVENTPCFKQGKCKYGRCYFYVKGDTKK